MKKFYLFRQGDPVPKWLMNWESNNAEAEFQNSRKGKIVFGMSCVGIRVPGCNTGLIQTRPMKNGECIIRVSGLDECALGGVNGASGCFIVDDEHLPEFHKMFEDYINGRIPHIFQGKAFRSDETRRPENWHFERISVTYLISERRSSAGHDEVLENRSLYSPSAALSTMT